MPDAPRSFGYKTTWLAIKTEDTNAVFNALGLKDKAVANWETGRGFAYSRAFQPDVFPVFIMPPIQGWTLVNSNFAFASGSEAGTADLERELERLSLVFDECQYFGNYRVVGYVSWYRAVRGEVVRGFSFADGVMFANKGKTTPAELQAGLPDMTNMSVFEFMDAVFPEEEPYDTYKFDEDSPMRIAKFWSVDTRELDSFEGAEPTTGLVGLLRK